jgi:hypothetical protein
MLRQAIEDRGLDVLVAETGDDATTKMRRQVEEGITIDTFEPLLSANLMILTNTMETLGPSGLYLMSEGPEDPVEGYGKEYEGRTWSRCPLCYLNLAHEVSCSGCDLPQENGYDFWIDKAADGQFEMWKSLKQ